MARYHKINSGTMGVSIRSFPADECLDRFAELQSMCIGELSVFFGAPEGEKLSQTQIAEAIASVVTSLSRTLDSSTFKKIRETLIDPEYVSVSRDNGEFVRLDKAAIHKLDLTPAELIFVLIESAKYQFSDVFTAATNLTGTGSSQTLVGRLLASLKTAQSDTK